MFHKTNFFLFIILLILAACNGTQDSVSFDKSKLARMEFSGSAEINFGEVVVNSVNDVEFEVKNAGAFDATSVTFGAFDPSGAFSYVGGEFPGLGGNCSGELKSGSDCKIVLRFQPTKSGDFSEILPIRFANGVQMDTQSIKVSGRAGTLASIQSDMPVYFYGALDIGEIATKTVTITNTGDLTAKNLSMVFSPLNDFAIETTTCGANLLGHASCTIKIRYTSQSLGAKTSTLKINYNSGVVTTMTPVVLKAVSDVIEGRLELNSDSINYDFGIVPRYGSSFVHLSFKNVGYDNLVISNVLLNSPYTFEAGQSSCIGHSITINEVCELVFKFSPLTTGVLLLSDISIDYDGGKGSKNLTLSDFLSGRGLDAAVISTNTEQDSAEFPLTGVGNIQLVTLVLTNVGSMDANPLVMGTFPSTGVISANQTSGCFAVNRINRGGQNCSINFLFQPTTTGVFSETLNFNYFNGIETISKTITVSGRAIRKAKLELISVDKTALDNPILTSDVSDPVLVTIKNVGTGTARDLRDNIVYPFFYANVFGPFAGVFPGVGGDCPADGTLPAGAECTLALSVNYQGSKNAFLNYEVIYNDGIDDKNLSDPSLELAASFVVPGSILGGVSSPLHWKFPSLIGNFPAKINQGSIGTVDINHQGDFPVSFTNFSAAITNAPNCGDDDLPTEGMYITATCNNLTVLSGNSCEVDVFFNPQCVGMYEGQVDVTYTTAAMAPATLNKTFYFKAESKALGHLIVTPASQTGTTLVGNSISRQVTVTNTGLGNAQLNVTSAISPIALPGVIDVSGGGILSSVIIAPGGSEVITVAFNPPSTPKSHTTSLNLKFDNSDDFDDYDTITTNDLYSTKSLSASVIMTSGYTSQIVINNNIPTLNVGQAVVGEVISKTITVQNAAGLAVNPVSFAFTGAGAARYTASPTSCVLASGTTCNVVITYTADPNGLLGNSPATFTASYFDGIQSQSKSIALTATTATQSVNHAGWERIKAVSDLASSTITLKWKPFTALSTTIHSYHVYRRLAWQSFNFNAPLAMNITNDYYTDTTATPNNEYYYLISPVYVGNNMGAIPGATKDYPSFPAQLFSQVQIIAPPKYMALIHRWEANRQVCEEYLDGAIQNPNDNFSCSAYAQGSTNSKFDLGKHLFVDRYEINTGVGATDYNEPLKTPKQNFDQQGANGAWDFCRNSARNITLQTNMNNAQTAVVKSQRLMGLLEYRLAVEFEDANDLTEASCATYSGNVTGDRPDCVSRYGIYDLVGNGFEWLRDKMTGGNGSSGSNIENNWAQDSYLNGLSYAGLNTSYYNDQVYSLWSCYSPILGIPVPLISGGCGNNILMNTMTLPDSFYKAPYDVINNVPVPTVLQAGGGNSGTLSKHNLFWAIGDTSAPKAGARCSFSY